MRRLRRFVRTRRPLIALVVLVLALVIAYLVQASSDGGGHDGLRRFSRLSPVVVAVAAPDRDHNQRQDESRIPRAVADRRDFRWMPGPHLHRCG